MAFNANLPQANSPISSAELRDQFNALKALIDQRPTMAEVTSSTAANVNNIEPVTTTFSNPPTQADLVTIAVKLNELLNQLQH